LKTATSTSLSNFLKALITGIGGSGGSYLADYLVAQQPQVEVHGITRWHSATTLANLAECRSRVHLHECDLGDFVSVLEVMQKVKPDMIFHLASHANVRTSFITPLAVLQNNIGGTANLLEAVRVTGLSPRIQLCSTPEVYGRVAKTPITEDAPMNPVSPYAVSKAAQDLLGYAYFSAYQMPIIRTRMFTYLNPRRADLFATSFALQVARIERGLQAELLHGNLESTRTYIDVRDAVEAYWVAIEKCVPGEAYNIGGTMTKTVGEFLEILKLKSHVPIPSRVDPRLLRPADATLQIPSMEKFVKATGWRPKYSFEQSVEHLLQHCRAVVDREVEALAVKI
jgi:GDPmannose 4,6-dehydratase/GDP-4-dehydro-6-deoxy-D-mannose reductase